MIAIVFHLPICFNDGEPVPEHLINRLINDIIDRAGGITIVHCEGAWKYEGQLFREPVLRVMTGIPESEIEAFVELIDECLKTDFQQIAVWIEVDGKPSIR